MLFFPKDADVEQIEDLDFLGAFKFILVLGLIYSGSFSFLFCARHWKQEACLKFNYLIGKSCYLAGLAI